MKKEDADLLCNVEGRAPMATLFRSYWLPVLRSDELQSEGAPRRVRLLGRNYVAFRDSEGEVGLLDENCPHRGASLVLARNEDCALQCLYHGWRIDREGQILETPAEPAGRNTIGNNIHQPSYPCVEAGEIVWVYLGEEAQPPPPQFDFTGIPPENILVYKSQLQTNWLRGLDGGFDTAHVMYLHANGLRSNWAGGSSKVPPSKWEIPSGGDDVVPQIEVERTPYGLRYAGIRQGSIPGTSFVRSYHFVLPGYAYIPATNSMASMMAFVPIDNWHTLHWGILYRTDDQAMTYEDREDVLRQLGRRPGIDIDDEGRGFQNRSNQWGQDREAMMRRESFSGIAGIWDEDYAVQESMPPDVHTREHLGASDLAVIRVRRILLDLAKDIQSGKNSAPAFPNDFDLRRIRAAEAVVSAGSDWRDVAPWLDLEESEALVEGSS